MLKGKAPGRQLINDRSASDISDVITETAARAEQLLFDKRGGLHRDEQYLRSLAFHTLMRPAGSFGQTDFTGEGRYTVIWQGTQLIYDAGMAEIFLQGARDGDQACDQVLCHFGAIMLHATGGIADNRLRAYVCNRLAGATPPITKKKRGRSAADNRWRDVCISLWLIPPLMQRGFPATRNEATWDSESACSIVSQALKKIGIALSEKGVATVWGKFSHSFDSQGRPLVLNK
jgi:hypothetical protein